jgi:hypothetical protein
MKKILLLMFAGLLLMAGTYKLPIQISVGDDVLDSVQVLVYEEDSTTVDSFAAATFPFDTVVVINDSVNTKVVYRYYYAAEDPAYRTTAEFLHGNPTGGYVDSVAAGALPAGSNVRGFFVVDTSGTDDTLPGITISLEDVNGIDRGNLLTNSAGFTTINMPDSTWTAKASAPGYVFIDTTFSASANDTLSIKGYDITVGAPSGGNEVRVFGYAYDVLDTADALQNVWAHIELVSPANNTCDSTLTVRFQKKEITDATGLFSFDVVRSSCLGNTEYKVWLEYKSGQTAVHQFTAPDQATFRLLW